MEKWKAAHTVRAGEFHLLLLSATQCISREGLGGGRKEKATLLTDSLVLVVFTARPAVGKVSPFPAPARNCPLFCGGFSLPLQTHAVTFGARHRHTRLYCTCSGKLSVPQLGRCSRACFLMCESTKRAGGPETAWCLNSSKHRWWSWAQRVSHRYKKPVWRQWRLSVGRTGLSGFQPCCCQASSATLSSVTWLNMQAVL